MALFTRDGRIKVVELFEANNGTCEMMQPVIESASVVFAGKVDFFRMDVSELDDIVAKYHIQRKPFFLLIRGDEVIDTIYGLVPMISFIRFIQSHVQ